MYIMKIEKTHIHISVLITYYILINIEKYLRSLLDFRASTSIATSKIIVEYRLAIEFILIMCTYIYLQ